MTDKEREMLYNLNRVEKFKILRNFYLALVAFFVAVAGIVWMVYRTEKLTYRVTVLEAVKADK